MAQTRKRLPPMHPGEVLREEYMKPLGLSAAKIAKACHIPRTRISRVAKEETGITPDTALRLGKLFGTTPQFWINLQNHYELGIAMLKIAGELKDIEPKRLVA